jgi:hypothetical protein
LKNNAESIHFTEQKKGKKKKNEKKRCWRQRKVANKSAVTAMGEVVDETKGLFNAFIGEIAEAPIHLVDNEFIRRGYRIGYTRSVKSIFKSLF